MSDLFHVLQNKSFIDLCMYQFGYCQNNSLSSYGPFVRNHYLFHYVISGTGTLQATDSEGADHKFLIRSGQGFLIFPGQITTYWADEHLPWEYTWIEFDGMHAKEALILSGLSMNNPIYRSSDKTYTEKMMNTMLYIADHPAETDFNLISHLYMFIDCLTRSCASKTIPTGDSMSKYYLEWAFDYIDRNFHNGISVADIADSCKIHRNYLCRIFRDHLGISPQEFLITYRMSKAAQLLRTTKLPVKDIGNAVGYPNQLHFSRAFKNVYGKSPKQWRDEPLHTSSENPNGTNSEKNFISKTTPEP
ncbi:MAG: AraC family transcriptional regulator [Eubacterium sp.]|nr:AraC family transcriptional regulator [Eubacterium sp.]